MPADLAINDKFQITFVGQRFGQTIMNTFGYEVTAIGGGPVSIATAYDLITLSDEFAALSGSFLTVLPTTYEHLYTWVQRIAAERNPKYVLPVSLLGDIAEEELQQNTSVVISRHGAFADRKNNGRVMLSSPNNSDYVSQGEITPAYKALLDVLAGNMLDPLTHTIGAQSATFTPAILGYEPISGTVTSRPIVQVVVEQTARVMTRRTKGRGI